MERASNPHKTRSGFDQEIHTVAQVRGDACALQHVSRWRRRAAAYLWTSQCQCAGPRTASLAELPSRQCRPKNVSELLWFDKMVRGHAGTASFCEYPVFA